MKLVAIVVSAVAVVGAQVAPAAALAGGERPDKRAARVLPAKNPEIGVGASRYGALVPAGDALLLNGKPVLSESTLELAIAQFDVESVVQRGSADAFLVAGRTDGRACPAHWFVVEVSARGHNVSDVFGGCGSEGRARLGGRDMIIQVAAFANDKRARGWTRYAWNGRAVTGPDVGR